MLRKTRLYQLTYVFKKNCTLIIQYFAKNKYENKKQSNYLLYFVLKLNQFSNFYSHNRVVPSSNITDVSLEGVKGHHDNHVASGNMESKGVKAHFRMDESGVLTLESVRIL